MSYLTQDTISDNEAMRDRVSQCAAGEQIPDADHWAFENRRIWAAAPGWDAAWESSLVSQPPGSGYDPGKDEAVITDGMILSQVQGMNAG
jgi:hypothetical protein